MFRNEDMAKGYEFYGFVRIGGLDYKFCPWRNDRGDERWSMKLTQRAPARDLKSAHRGAP
jgi:hypothetical protein